MVSIDLIENYPYKIIIIRISYLYMKKISITFNLYEYSNIKAFTDMPFFSGSEYLINIEIKDIIWDAFYYAFYTIKKSDTYLHAFLNLFLEKYGLPIFTDVQEEKIPYPWPSFQKNKKASSFGNPRTLPGPSHLYILKLTDFDMDQLNQMSRVISGFLPQLQWSGSYSEILRACLHFVIDYKSQKIAFSSLIYASLLFDIPGYLPLSEDMLHQIHEVIRLEDIASIISANATFQKQMAGKTFQEGAKKAIKIMENWYSNIKGIASDREDSQFPSIFLAYSGYIAMRSQIINMHDDIPSLTLRYYILDMQPANILEEWLHDFISFTNKYIDLLAK